MELHWLTHITTGKDKLTDLPNLMFFTKLCELERENLKKTGSKAAYAYFNIMNMKAYNSHYNFSERKKRSDNYRYYPHGPA
ncbi:MAG: hypothetical protein K6E78_11365, partial [Treponema sp.]|nr:hypothetical protein [Treponema sp.]